VFAITVDASSTPDGLRCALNSTVFDGTCASPSVYLSEETLPLFAMCSRCCTFHTGELTCVRPSPTVVELVAAGFGPTVVISSVVAWNEAAEALAEPPIKLVVRRPSD
jgi:threonine dehydrogenase-like Zn-dependent dehydrogenase